MKTLRLIFLLSIVTFSYQAFSQQTKDELKAAQQTAVEGMVVAKDFVFRAQTAMPSKGPTQQLSYGYTLTVAPDEVVSYLPYFGRAYQATINPSEGGIEFTSTEFDYTINNRKKGGWDITLVPKDVPNAPKLYFSVTTNGKTSLRVISTNRESISFSGLIEEKKQD